MKNVVQVLSALSDPIRLRSLGLILRTGEVCVCEICHALQIAQPKASKHLGALRDAGVVSVRRDAQWTYYALAEDLPSWGRAAVEAAVAGLAEDPTYGDDLERLQQMPGKRPRTRVA